MNLSRNSTEMTSTAKHQDETTEYHSSVLSECKLDSSHYLSLECNSFLSDDVSDTKSSPDKVLNDSKVQISDEDFKNEYPTVSYDEYLTDDASFLPESDIDVLAENASVTIYRVPSSTENDSTEEMMRELSIADEVTLNEKNCSSLSELHHSTTSVNVISDRESSYKQSANITLEEHKKQQTEEERDSEGSDASSDLRFELYLKKLRDSCVDNKTKRVTRDRIPLSSFIVNDSDTSCSSNSEGEISDVSWDSGDVIHDGKNKRQGRQSCTLPKNSLDNLAVTSKKSKEIDQDEYFLTSLSPNYVGNRHPDAELYVKKGIRNEKLRNDLTKRLFDIFRTECFNEKIPEFLTIIWNARLRKTAGLCRNKSDRTSCIELSPKVCSTPDRVRDTLVHELCHAAVWIVDGHMKEGHGSKWREWASKCMRRFQSLPIIDRCHNYEIEAKFIYECGGCGQQVRRHTKSFDIKRRICGICKCSFTLNVRSRSKKAGVEPDLNSFAKFVKENYAKHRNPNVKHGDVMRTLSQLYKERTSSNNISTTDHQNELDLDSLSIID